MELEPFDIVQVENLQSRRQTVDLYSIVFLELLHRVDQSVDFSRFRKNLPEISLFSKKYF